MLFQHIQYYAHCSLTIIISVDVPGVQGKTLGTKRAREDGHAGEHCMETELNMMPDPLEAVVKSAISNPDCSIDLEYLQHALNAGHSFYFIRHRISVALDTNLYHLPPKKLYQRRRGFETTYSISNPYCSIDFEYTITDDEVEDIYNEVMTSR